MRQIRWIAVSALALFVGACGAGWQASVRTAAAPYLGCPAESVQVTDASLQIAYLYVSAYSARGCGREAIYVWDQTVGDYVNADIQLIQRATFEMACPAEQLWMQPLGSWTTRGVEGCGRRMVYTYSPATHQWTSGGTPEALPPPPPPPPPPAVYRR